MTGRTDSYIIHADGSVEQENGNLRRGTLTPAKDGAAAAAVFRQVARAIAALQPGDYAPKNACCDRAAYSITITVDGKEYTYTTIDAAANQPQALSDMLDLVRAYLATFGA